MGNAFLANLRYLIFKIVWRSMLPDPLERLKKFFWPLCGSTNFLGRLAPPPPPPPLYRPLRGPVPISKMKIRLLLMTIHRRTKCSVHNVNPGGGGFRQSYDFGSGMKRLAFELSLIRVYRQK